MVILDSSTIMARQACSALAQIFLTKLLLVSVIAMTKNVCLSTRQPYLKVTRPTRTGFSAIADWLAGLAAHEK